jgi:CheY-like chemotaxis protein
MTNILVVDTAECSCFLVRSILLGKRYGVSMSTTAEDARMKIETGLFDLVYVDLSAADKKSLEFVQYVNELLPGLPIVALYREESEDKLDGLSFYRKVQKPISVTSIIDAARHAIEDLVRKSIAGGKPLELDADITIGDETVHCRAVTLSPKAALFESDKPDFDAMNSFHSFFHKKSAQKMTTVIHFDSQHELKVVTRVMFLESSPDNKLKQVAVCFADVDKAQQDSIEEFLKKK